jgi:pimeloyl-ACP methyl ester carboxylesterase
MSDDSAAGLPGPPEVGAVASRRTVLSGAVATGIAVTGLAGTQTRLRAEDGGAAMNIKIEAGGTVLSGVFRGAGNAKAMIFCIHGGSYTSHYFGFRSQTGATLFDLAPKFGYAVAAIDRPGYGAAERLVVGFDQQAEILREAAAKCLAQCAPASAGVFIVGHSIGAMLAILVAGEPGTLKILGIDLNGAGIAYRPASEKGLAAYVAMPNPPREPNKERRLQRMFGPSGTYDGTVADEDFQSAPLSQPSEIREAVGWPGRVRNAAAPIKVPVNFSLSEYDALWDPAPELINQAARMFRQSPLVEARVQRFAGHSVHLHRVARAFNLRTLAFLDDCLNGFG